MGSRMSDDVSVTVLMAKMMVVNVQSVPRAVLAIVARDLQQVPQVIDFSFVQVSNKSSSLSSSSTSFTIFEKKSTGHLLHVTAKS